MNDTFAIRLLRAMNNKGFNATQLSDASYVHKSTIHYFLQNVSMPSIKVLLKLCKALDIDPNTLLGWNDETH